MPPLSFILERAYGTIKYEPLTKNHLLRAGQSAQVTSEEIQEWLEAGKAKQREHIAKLHEDPEWNAMARHLGAFPGMPTRRT